jgi:hypothetical protein
VKGAFECLICKAGLLPTRVEPRKNFFRPLMARAFLFHKIFKEETKGEKKLMNNSVRR